MLFMGVGGETLWGLFIGELFYVGVLMIKTYQGGRSAFSRNLNPFESEQESEQESVSLFNIFSGELQFMP